MITLKKLPPSMLERAIKARQIILEHPEKAHIDYDELLAWVYHEEDEVWYSIDGNYSQYSPEEKKDKRKKLKEREVEYEKRADEKYLQMVYYSKVRKTILERDNYTCQLCNKKGDSKLHVHHILKRTENGKDYFDNLLTVCPKCHAAADRNLYNPDWEE